MSPEILAPAGDLISARAALDSGADAVYLGLPRFSARSSAENFGEEAFAEVVTHAHLLGAKVYVCLNTLVKDAELKQFCESVLAAWNGGADAILMQDLFLGKKLKERYPGLVLHLSTQAGCCNVRGAEFAKECGFSRVVLARETPLKDISKIASVLETEVFVQGALCTCFSGQCYLSSFAGNNSGNRGRCKQPCRKRYSIDRAGYEEFAYALSPSDLSVGERIRDLLSAGVVSLKIEGRMRRPEYVAAAVRYYRALLSGEDGKGELSDLMRAYNRGGYTQGLAFGQGKDFLSRNVQGHIGERVGFTDEKGFVTGGYPARKGDGFKILRGGKEVCGAVFAGEGKGGFRILAGEKLRPGDEVRLTTDSALAERLGGKRRRKIALSLSFAAGRPAEITCGSFVFRGQAPERAKSAPLTEEELRGCFRKTDGLPFEVSFKTITAENAFLPKSALNALRREFYSALVRSLLPPRSPLEGFDLKGGILPSEGGKRAVIAEEPERAEILIFKPRDFGKIPVPSGEGEKFLYLPPFFTGEDEEAVLPALPLFDGIFCDGFYGLSLAKEHGMRFFAGTGCNLTNAVAVSSAREAGADYLALSKELSASEQRALAAEGAFALTAGAVKVMDLCYCPFERSCASCDGRELYRLTDEEGRVFPLRRYRAGDGSCRFELFNCARLAAVSPGTNTLEDRSVPLPAQTTRGHSERSML